MSTLKTHVKYRKMLIFSMREEVKLIISCRQLPGRPTEMHAVNNHPAKKNSSKLSKIIRILKNKKTPGKIARLMIFKVSCNANKGFCK